MEIMATTGNLIDNVIGNERKVPPFAASSEFDGSAIAEEPATVHEASVPGIPLAPRNAGDEVNRFLLCALIRESSRQIRTAANTSGVCLPFQRIIRRLMDSYSRAAGENPGLLSGPTFNSSTLRRLNEKVRKEEIGRYSKETVLSSQLLLAHAKRIGDQIRIKAAEEVLEGALLAQERLAQPE
jgi:hypothetical protein